MSFSRISEKSSERLDSYSIVVIAPVEPTQKTVTVPLSSVDSLTASETKSVISTIPQSAFTFTEISFVSTGMEDYWIG